MLGQIKLKKIASVALKEAKRLGATQTEVVIAGGSEELTRFANSMIHQSVSLTDVWVHVRVIVDKKIGVARSDKLDKSGILELVKTAYVLATLQRPDPHFVSLPRKAGYQSTARHYKSVGHIGALARAKAVSELIKIGQESGLAASGAFSESESEIYIGNSLGVAAYQLGKSASLTAIMTGGKGTGFASHAARGGRHIDVKSVALTAAAKATTGEVVDVPAGKYEVILEPAAVSELLDFFAWYGPNARIYHEDVSFYQGNLGKKLLSELLTIVDDPLHPAGYPTAFDAEGTPKTSKTLVDKGVLTGVVYDSYHSHKYKQANTGHALLAPNTYGPIPTHLTILPGKLKTEQMIKKIKNGLLVTRFWYTRVVQHKQLMLTGMTRDGTFVIKNGKIVGRARNLRYTESVIEAFRHIKGVGREVELIGSEGSPSLIPALHIGKFRFTGTTKHG